MYKHQYPKSQKFLKNEECDLCPDGKAKRAIKKGDVMRICLFHLQYPKAQKFLKETEEALGEKAAFVDIKERDLYLVEAAKYEIECNLKTLVARIGLPATKSFILDWVDTMKF